mmetsp:Transcript_28017/g.82018  ORF Transcript_28017/g.82018 Transcript_28017/m.82018 type:complete len:218 (-) Transcript_28017:446-1099(-)
MEKVLARQDAHFHVLFKRAEANGARGIHFCSLGLDGSERLQRELLNRLGSGSCLISHAQVPQHVQEAGQAKAQDRDKQDGHHTWQANVEVVDNEHGEGQDVDRRLRRVVARATGAVVAKEPHVSEKEPQQPNAVNEVLCCIEVPHHTGSRVRDWSQSHNEGHGHEVEHHARHGDDGPDLPLELVHAIADIRIGPIQAQHNVSSNYLRHVEEGQHGHR